MSRRRAFSTLGCPDASVDEVVALTRASGWTGLELRSAPDSFAHVGLSATERAGLRRALSGTTRICLATYVVLDGPDLDDAAVLASLEAETALARDLGFSAIRVFAGGDDDDAIVRRLRRAASASAVDILLETHDSHPTGLSVARVLDAVDDERVGAIWDIAHPWAAGEPVSTTAHVLEPWLRHVQLKDAASARENRPVLPGTGTVPLGEVLLQLDARGYDGFLSLEWERRWYPELPELPVALAAADDWLAGFPAAERRLATDVEDALGMLSLDEKVALVTGRDFWSTTAIPRIGLRPIVVSDGPAGVRGPSMDERQPSLGMPALVALAATWDPALAYEVGRELAHEAAAHGVDVVLGPTVNIPRTPLGGRSFECLSEDPLLTTDLASRYARGLRDEGVAACVKHYVLNDSETERMTVSVEADENALREIYLRPFERLVDEGVATVMSAYNSVRGVTMTENELLTDPLVAEWGFDGVVISDWSAVRSVDAAAAAQHLEMPGPRGAWGGALRAAIESGAVPAEVLDDKVRRILRLAERAGALQLAGTVPRPRPSVAPRGAAAVARTVAAAGSVLLRNDGILPLAEGTTVALIGRGATRPRTQGGGSAAVLAATVSTPADALAAEAGLTVTVHDGSVAPLGEAFGPGELRGPDGQEGVAGVRLFDEDGTVLVDELRAATRLIWLGDLPDRARRLEVRFEILPSRDGRLELSAELPAAGTFAVGDVVLEAGAGSESVVEGAHVEGGGTVTTVLDVVVGEPVPVVLSADAPEDLVLRILDVRIARRFLDDGHTLRAEAVAAAAAADVAVVFVGTDSRIESEGRDRSGLRLPDDQDALVDDVLAVNPRTVVVVTTGGPVELPWRDRAAAVLVTWFGGQEIGAALADVVTGRVEPAGRLPVTWPATLDDAPVREVAPTDGVLRYREGLDIGYRAWTSAVAPAFPFGHGLGYTTWDVDRASVLDDPAPTVEVHLRNTGSRAGRQIVQVYLSRVGGSVPRPTRWLAAFAGVSVPAGGLARLRLALPRTAFEYWSDSGWALDPGDYQVSVGLSADDIRVTLPLSLPAEPLG